MLLEMVPVLDENGDEEMKEEEVLANEDAQINEGIVNPGL